jgi:hypothetical protein
MNLALTLLIGCSAHVNTPVSSDIAETHVDATPEVSEAPTPVPSTEDGPPKTAPFAGDWTGEACGERAYPQVLSFSDSGDFTAQDLISPCPKDATCIWSGVVTRKGSWSQQAMTITLTQTGETPESPKPAAALPTTLTLAHDILKSTNDCAYRRSG